MSVIRTLPDGSTERLRGESIRAYAGEVFRRHNAASSALLEALPFLEAEAPEVAEKLLGAEETMNSACAPVDAVAVRHRDGESVDLGDQLAFARALESCERETAALETLLAAASGSA
ncbi:MAG: hypothetical protein AAGA68_07970 [Pseudomonadota bacterium]